jgi:hypothetical protein
MSPKTTATIERLKKPEDMTPEEKAKYDALAPAQKTIHNARVAAQEAQDALTAANKAEEDARTQARRDRTITAAEKKLASALRSGEIKDENGQLEAAIKSIAITGAGAVSYLVKPPTTVREELKPSDEEIKAIAERVREAAKRATPAASTSGGRKSIPAPTWKLGYELKGLTKAQMMPPTDGGQPDASLAALVHRYGFVLPFTVLPANEQGLHPIFDGRRRYHLLNDTETVAAVVLSGFPDEATQEGAEVAVNRARSLNVLRAGEIITRARTRGKSDTDIRADMGFKTGEVDKYAKALNLPAVIVQGIKDGRVTANTALLIGKQPAHIVEKLAADFTKRRAEETEKQPARISEADVEALRVAGSQEAIKRDASTLTALTGAVQPEDATGAASVNP